jgi:hypothetical protein
VKHVLWDNMSEREALTLPPENQFVLRCKHCGDRYVLPVPATVTVMAAVTRAYVKDHRHCKPPGETPASKGNQANGKQRSKVHGQRKARARQSVSRVR